MSSAALDSGQPCGSAESSGLVRVELLVTGMTCAACAARVEGRLNAIENVSATVNIATEKATVTAPPSVPVPAGLGPGRRRAAFEREEPSGDGAGTKSGDETKAKEHTASCLE